MRTPLYRLYTDGTLLCRGIESVSRSALEKLNINQESVRHLSVDRPISIRAVDRFQVLESIQAPAVELYGGASFPCLSRIDGNVGVSGHVQMPRLLSIKGATTIRSVEAEIPWLTMIDGSLWCCVGSRLPRLTTITGEYMPATAENTPALIRVGRSLNRSNLQPRSSDVGLGASIEHRVGIDASRALGLDDVARAALAVIASEYSSNLEEDDSQESRWSLSI